MANNDDGRKSLMKGILNTNLKEKGKISKRISWGGMNIKEYQKENGNNTEEILPYFGIDQANVGNLFLEKNKTIGIVNKNTNNENSLKTHFEGLKIKINSASEDLSNFEKNKQTNDKREEKPFNSNRLTIGL